MKYVRLSDRVGEVYGRLTIISIGDKYPKVVCICECGARAETSIESLKRGQTQSCGCLSAERSSAANLRHGHTRSPTYLSWQAMKSRTQRTGDVAYSRYGGDGIGIDPRWNSFTEFLADMGVRPEGTTLDRYPDKDGSYTASNCRWATAKQQAQNRKNSLYVEVEGQQLPFTDACKTFGIKAGTVYARYRRGKDYNHRLTLQSVFNDELKRKLSDLTLF